MIRISACAVEQLVPGDMLRIPTCPPVAVFRVDDEFFCTADTCTHMEFPLSEGYLEEFEIECSVHMARFDVRTGRAVCLPATDALETFDVEIEGGRVVVLVREDMVGNGRFSQGEGALSWM